MFALIIDSIGRTAIKYTWSIGGHGVFIYQAIATFVSTKLKNSKVVDQANHIGVSSAPAVMVASSAVGGVLAMQSYEGLHRFGVEQQFIGPLVFLSMVREFGPVLSAIMVAGRAGSAMTAELGTMQITEQIDALKTLCIDINQYLVVPRILATTVMLPLLSLFGSACGIAVGYAISIHVLGCNSTTYVEAIQKAAEMSDLSNGLVKATIFGFLLSTIACYVGLSTRGGAKNIGISTTQSVVYATITIILADYILSAFMFTS